MSHTFSNRKQLAMAYDRESDTCHLFVQVLLSDETVTEVVRRAHAINLDRWRKAPYGSDARDIAYCTMRALENGRVAQVLPSTGEIRLHTAKHESTKTIFSKGLIQHG